MLKIVKLLNKKKNKNTSWNFNLDQVNTYAFWNNAFTKKECQSIIDIAKNKGLIKGETKGKTNVRDNQISWLYASDNIEWVFRRVTDIVLSLNKQFFNFDLFGLNEGFQFTNYVAPSNKYGQHTDKAYAGLIRKLSLSIQLTDPKEYEGGELFLYENKNGDEMKKEQGTLILFPSYVLHEVKPVTKGERNSLVSWVTGQQFK